MKPTAIAIATIVGAAVFAQCVRAQPPGGLGRGGEGADRGGGGGGGGLYGGGGGGGCSGYVDDAHPCTISLPGSGGGGSSLVPPGGTVSVSNVLEPSVIITITQYV